MTTGASYSKAVRSRASQPTFTWPTLFRVITQEPGARHRGAWDIRTKGATPLFAIENAVVEKTIANDPRGYGNLIILRDPRTGNRFYYAHLSAFGVKPGQTVRAGQPIGVAGSTGHSTGPHLHFEIRDPQGRYIDPNLFFAGSRFVDPSSRTGFSLQTRTPSLSPAAPQRPITPAPVSPTPKPARQTVSTATTTTPTGTSSTSTETTTGSWWGTVTPVSVSVSPTKGVSLQLIPPKAKWGNILAVVLGSALVIVAVGKVSLWGGKTGQKLLIGQQLAGARLVRALV